MQTHLYHHTLREYVRSVMLFFYFMLKTYFYDEEASELMRGSAFLCFWIAVLAAIGAAFATQTIGYGIGVMIGAGVASYLVAGSILTVIWRLATGYLPSDE